nr:MAG TPA: hypothetical protein [Caudoviricetes sp.]
MLFWSCDTTYFLSNTKFTSYNIINIISLIITFLLVYYSFIVSNIICNIICNVIFEN